MCVHECGSIVKVRKTWSSALHHVDLESEPWLQVPLPAEPSPSPALFVPFEKGLCFYGWGYFLLLPPPSVRLTEGVIVKLSKILHLSCRSGESQDKGAAEASHILFKAIGKTLTPTKVGGGEKRIWELQGAEGGGREVGLGRLLLGLPFLQPCGACDPETPVTPHYCSPRHPISVDIWTNTPSRAMSPGISLSQTNFMSIPGKHF